MRLIVILIVLALIACTQLLQGESQPVKQIDDNQFVTTCSGLAESMGDCFYKAQKTCNGQYSIVREVRDSSGLHRELKFVCK